MDAECGACGVTFVARRGRGGTVARWCSRSCYQWARRNPGQLRPRDRVCAGCGVDIAARPRQAKWCSKVCCEMHIGNRRSSPLPPAACALPECGKAFQPWREGQRCCSEKHGKVLYNRESRADGRQKPQPWNDKRRDRYHRRRALKKAASTGEPVLLAAIAERDGWRCCLCGKRVNRRLKWPDPLSPSLDHLVPLSKGGAHDPSNVALAHLVCNTAKNNRGGGEQLLLIG